MIRAALLFIPLLVFAQAPAFVPDEAGALEVLRPLVKTMDRPITTFHWEKANSEFSRKFDTSKPEGNLALARAQTESFLKLNTKYGFYLATDPATSRQYGGADPQGYRLMVVELPRDFRYLDLQLNLALRLKLKPILGERCAFDFVNPLSAEFEEGPCADMKRKIFKELKIAGIRYGFAQPKIRGLCPGEDQSAFILTDPSWLRPEYLKTFTAGDRDELEARRRINEIVTIALKPDKVKALWADLLMPTKVSDETRRWMRENLLNCQADGPKGEDAAEEHPGGASAE